jgi:hypothetical protein
MSPHLQRLFASPWLALASLSAAVLLLEPAPAWAGLDIGGLILHGGRARVVQVCVACMILGLFIMMKKLTEDGPVRRGTRPAEPTEPPSAPRAD